MDKNVFVQIEKQLALFEREYAGFPYWQYLRFSLCESLFGNRHSIEKQIAKNNHNITIKRLFGVLLDVIKDIKLFVFGRNCDMLVFKQEIVKNKFFDYWKFPDNLKTYTFGTDTYSDNFLLNEHHLGIPRIERILSFRLRSFLEKDIYDENERAFLTTLETILINRFGQSMSCMEMEEVIHKAFLTHRYYKRYFNRLFDKLQCRAILTIVYYQDVLYPAYEVAKERGIKIIELQHGVINNHESYWFEDRRGLNNYTPDYLLTYGDIHNQWIKLVNGSKAISVGFPYQEYMVSKLKDITPREDTVIVYPDSFPDFERIINEFVNLHKEYRVIIKLHPLQSGHAAEYFPVLSHNKNAVFVNSQDKGIYYWLKYAKHHVMASTTVGLEAMVFDHCNVCIIESVPHEQTQCLLDWGVARGFKTVDELVGLIQNPIVDMPSLQVIRDQLWKRNAKKNIERVFEILSVNGWRYPR